MAELEPSEANLRLYLQVLRRRLHWVLVLTVFAVAVAVAYGGIQKKEYSATAQLLVEPTSGIVPIAGTQQTVSPTDVLTDLQLLTGVQVKDKAAKVLGFTPSISASESGQTNVIALTATAGTPDLAARVANVYARTFVDYQRTNAVTAITGAETQIQTQITALQNELAPLVAEKTPSAATTAQITGLTSQQTALQEQLTQLELAGSQTPGGIETSSLAIPPSSPSSPKLVKDGLIAFFVGLVLGVSAAFLIEYFDDRVYTKEDAERLSDAPVLAIVPKIQAWRKTGEPMVITELDPFSPVAEAYRSLRTSLRFLGPDGGQQTTLITSASGVEGKTSTAVNLGVVLAKAGERVVIVGCDLRRPRLGSFCGLAETPGFTSLFVHKGHKDLLDELRSVLKAVPSCPGLAFLGTGPIPPNPSELLESETAAKIFKVLATGFDKIIIDSPPLLPVTDAQILARLADTVIMVVMAGKTTRGQLERATQLLGQAGAKPTGIVLNRAIRSSGRPEYSYGYAYKYRYEPRGAETLSNGNGNGKGVKPLASIRRSP